MKMFPYYAEKYLCTNISKTNFYTAQFLATGKQVMVSTEERLEQIEQHASIFSSLYKISAWTILEEKRYYVVLGIITLRYF